MPAYLAGSVAGSAPGRPRYRGLVILGRLVAEVVFPILTLGLERGHGVGKSAFALITSAVPPTSDVGGTPGERLKLTRLGS